jgi:hypothetical protein
MMNSRRRRPAYRFNFEALHGARTVCIRTGGSCAFSVSPARRRQAAALQALSIADACSFRIERAVWAFSSLRLGRAFASYPEGHGDCSAGLDRNAKGAAGAFAEAEFESAGEESQAVSRE